jgi:mono/diheme cytochrome c family protein
MRAWNRRARIATTVSAWVLCAAGGVNAYAATAPGGSPVVARGEHLARLICSACHVVAVDQEFPPLLRQPTPSFSEIANRPDTSAKSLQKFISTTHWDEKTLPMHMPNPMLTDEQLRAVTRYILSLRKP